MDEKTLISQLIDAIKEEIVSGVLTEIVAQNPEITVLEIR